MERLSSGGKYRLSTAKQKHECDYPYPPSLKLIVVGVVLRCPCVSKSQFAEENGITPAGTQW